MRNTPPVIQSEVGELFPHADTKTSLENKMSDHRVINIPEDARETLVKIRDANGIRNEDVIAKVVTERIQGIVAAITAAGIQHHGKTRPMRIKIAEAVLTKLRYASTQTGIPMQSLLIACLHEPTAKKSPTKKSPAKKSPAKKSPTKRAAKKGAK